MKTSVFVGTSLDGFIARADGALDFLPTDPEDHGYEEFYASVDALVVVTRVPVLIGSGLPLFGPLGRDVHLRHVATRSYPSGLVQSEYEVLD